MRGVLLSAIMTILASPTFAKVDFTQYSGEMRSYCERRVKESSSCDSIADTKEKLRCLDKQIEKTQGYINQSRSEMNEADDAISWLKRKQASDTAGTEVARRACSHYSNELEVVRCMRRRMD